MAELPKVYDKGNFDLITAKYDELTNTFEEPYKWKGLMEINIDLSQADSKVSADDDPFYLDLKGPVTGTGTIKLVGIRLDEYEKLLPIEKDGNGALLFGADKPSAVFGMSFLNQHFEGEETSVNKTTFYKCTATIPTIATTSVADDGTTITEVSIPVNVGPYFYEVNGERKRVTLSKLNSVKHSAIWKEAKDIIYVPTAKVGQ